MSVCAEARTHTNTPTPTHTCGEVLFSPVEDGLNLEDLLCLQLSFNDEVHHALREEEELGRAEHKLSMLFHIVQDLKEGGGERGG